METAIKVYIDFIDTVSEKVKELAVSQLEKCVGNVFYAKEINGVYGWDTLPLNEPILVRVKPSGWAQVSSSEYVDIFYDVEVLNEDALKLPNIIDEPNNVYVAGHTICLYNLEESYLILKQVNE